MTDLRKVMQQALEALDCIYSPLHVREINKVGAAITDLRAALAQPNGPQEWVLMPVEPTEEMTSAGARSITEGREKRPGASWAKEAQMAYAAMLAAAPKGGA